ncbi:DUF3613 domain-containing protein [Chromohalobacter sp. 296-RDG]|uniref:DUF3613 domain-containing protein n=1 Tax=Chromohalobacter sp. 296-RDG TaxID=2994062 RepID=UPI002469506D|nr:DUF3613 domain-containing protein [Chromohalobacter sp. 296-RDG]
MPTTYTTFMTPAARSLDQDTGHADPANKHLVRLAMVALGSLALVMMANGQHAQAQQDTQGVETTRKQNDLSGHPGQATQRLLEWQRSGRGASSHRQELAGPVQSAIWQRYVESFEHEIPERYIENQEFGNK